MPSNTSSPLQCGCEAPRRPTDRPRPAIYVYSPSGAVRDKMAFRRGISHLKALGTDITVDADALRSHQRFAGEDATRLAAIERAAQSRADVAMISRGGYGISRLLDRLPYTALCKAVERGTQFVGFSDFTALQCALYAKTGAITWAGPHVNADFGVDGPPDDIMQACFEDLLLRQNQGTGWRLPRADAALLPNEELYVNAATLWGGNLRVLTALLGTPYFPHISKGILFLEDVNEQPYRVERMLTQLLHAGVLARQKAILWGQFTGAATSAHDRGYNLRAVIAWLRSRIKVPVLRNLPFGHVPTKVLLPVGAKVSLHISQSEAMLLWNH